MSHRRRRPPDGGRRETDSDDEDDSGESDWSVANNCLSRSSDSGNWSSQSDTLRIVILGAEVSASSDASLRALALEDASDNSLIDLDQTLASGTTNSTPSVANGVETITVKPTKDDNKTSIAWLEGSRMTLDDADTMKTGHQVSLDVGTNTIKVKVTAEEARPGVRQVRSAW